MADCDGKPVARGLCNKHWKRWSKYGHPEKVHEGPALLFLRQKVLTYDGNDCLIWPFSRSGGGYAQMKAGGRIKLVSRIVCEEENGEPPSLRHQAAHSCGNGHLGCVARKHLSWKSPVGNAADKIAHGTAPRGEKQGNARLSVADVLNIRQSPHSLRFLAQKYGVSESTISMARSKRTWAWLE